MNNRLIGMRHTALAAALVMVLGGCQQSHDPKQAALSPEKASAVPVLQVIQLKDTGAKNTKQFSGIVRAQEQAALAFRVPGTIATINVVKGDSVKQGQLIATLDPHDYQVALETLRAKKLEAQSAHKLAKAELKRVRQALADDAIASVNLDRAISGYERSVSAIKVIDKQIQRAQDTLSYTQLTAPFDGVIGTVNREAHEQILPGVALATLQDTMQLEVDIDVPETLISAFARGQQGAVSWYQSDGSLSAHVSEIATLPHLIKQTYTVTYRIEKGSAALFPGKSVSLTTHLGEVQHAYCVPYAALVGNKANMHVNVVRDQAVSRTPVKLTSLEANQACVEGALQAQDYVVVSGSQYLADGQRVDSLVVRHQ